MRRYFLAGSVFVFVAAVCAPTLPAHAEQPMGLPRSNQVIEGEVILPGSNGNNRLTAKFEIRDGTLLTIEDHMRRNYFFGFSGTINPATENPNIVPWKLVRSPEDEVGVEELGQSEKYNSREAVALRDLPVGRSRVFPAAGGIRIKVTDTYEREFAAPPLKDVDFSALPWEEVWAELQQDYGAFSNGGCCITCQGATICASSVSSSCGGCDGGGGGALAN